MVSQDPWKSACIIGSNTRSNADSQTNQVVIGHNTYGNGSNTVTLGNTLMKTSTYATQLKSIINSQVYSSVVYSLGSQLNDRKDRFDKADIIEQTVEAATDGRLVWVDDIGRDHRDIVENLDIEFKYMTDGMFTKRNNQKKIVKVKNSILDKS